tara:strand:- start:673 stop:1230 length:558 start_codon:yes stop_codon:yes gene_type:complete
MVNFWGNLSRKDLNLINNKKLLALNYLSLLVPDIYFLLKNKERLLELDNIPTLSFVIMDPMPRLVHVVFWYFGFFYRMKHLVANGSKYKFYYYAQLFSWILTNMFPVSKEGKKETDYLHYMSFISYFSLISIVKLYYSRDYFTYFTTFTSLVTSEVLSLNTNVAILERLCMYQTITTYPLIQLPN